MKKNKSTRLTRRSYKRKLIIFGVSIFMSIALSATGFAAWVISKDTQKHIDGKVEIGAVTEASVEIEGLDFVENKNTFIFEPLESDTTGRVRYDGSSKPENLNVQFTWTIKNYQIVGDVFVEFKLPSAVYTAVTEGWLSIPGDFTMAAPETIGDVNYTVLRYTIQAPSDPNNPKPRITENGSTSDGLLEYVVTKDDDGLVKDVTFTMDINFEWGSAFNGDNPGIYYDKTYEQYPNTGAEVSYADLKDTLNKFKATLHGLEYNDAFKALSEEAKAEKYTQNPIDKYYIYINAQVA